MAREDIERANRALLTAIETPPDTGREDRLDRLAARLWRASAGSGTEPDPGSLARIVHALDEAADQAPEPRAAELRRARRALDAHRADLGPVLTAQG